MVQASAIQLRTNSRLWEPSRTLTYGFRVRPLPPNKLLRWNRNRAFTQIGFYSLVQQRILRIFNSIVVAVDGASRGNNRSDPNSRAAFGIWFGNNSAFNTFRRLDPNEPQTNNRAELQAARQALGIIELMYIRGELDGIQHVIIKTDSIWLANSMSDWVWTWLQNGGRNSRGEIAAHWEDIANFHSCITAFEGRGIAVRFWWVERKWNAQADALANRALDE